VEAAVVASEQQGRQHDQVLEAWQREREGYLCGSACSETV